MDRRLVQDVRNMLQEAGFQVSGEGGLTVESTFEGIRVRWCPDYSLLFPVGHLESAKTDDEASSYRQNALAVWSRAVVAVLEQAGFAVNGQGGELLVNRAAAVMQEPPDAGTCEASEA